MDLSSFYPEDYILNLYEEIFIFLGWCSLAMASILCREHLIYERISVVVPLSLYDSLILLRKSKKSNESLIRLKERQEVLLSASLSLNLSLIPV
ncbi:hypothetical protein H8356DRAFT_1417493 [Neocallimastix lanati (nom. inval.)]|nr:hypothetical protein H8356DRAFT_1417493 [Neocallimastix sp. JGI-2020a]